MLEKAVAKWFAACLLAAAGAGSQVEPSARTHRVSASDIAVLDSAGKQTDLPCNVEVVRPRLAFDLRFHAGYRATLPVKKVTTGGDRLHVRVRVTPLSKPENRIYLVDDLDVPPLEEQQGEILVSGAFALGLGRYKLDWLMRNWGGKVCSTHWEVNVKASGQNVSLAIAPHTAAQLSGERFREPVPPERNAGGRLLHVKILANFSPATARQSALKSWDIEAMAAILRGIAGQPWIGRISLVAFNMQTESVIYRQENTDRINFRALEQAVEPLWLGVIDYRRLLNRQGALYFLTRLLTEHLGPQEPEPDAIAIVGPTMMVEMKVPKDLLVKAGRARGPIFYFNYTMGRYDRFRDAIGSALQVYQGQEYSIGLPRDLGAALTDMRTRIDAGPS